MKKIKVIAPILILIVMFVLSIEIITRYRLKYVEVYSVKTVLKPRTKIKEENLEKFKIPRSFLEDETVTEKDDLIGKYVKLNHHLYPNSMINKNEVESLAMSEDDALLGLMDHERLFSMKSGALESLGSMLRNGHRVDVYLRSSYTFDKTKTVKLAESVRVLGLKDRNGEDITEANSQPHTILLAIDEDKIAMFVEAQGTGDLVITGTNSPNKEAVYEEVEFGEDDV